jgi:histidinol-phosphate aminotransferase
LAGPCIGFAIFEEIIHVLNKIKPPYNISEATQQMALQGLQNEKEAKEKHAS